MSSNQHVQSSMPGQAIYYFPWFIELTRLLECLEVANLNRTVSRPTDQAITNNIACQNPFRMA